MGKNTNRHRILRHVRTASTARATWAVWYIGCMLSCIAHIGFAQMTYIEKYVCPNNPPRILYHSKKAPYSDSYCSSGTQVWAHLSSNNGNIISSVKAYKTHYGNHSSTVSVQVDWNPGNLSGDATIEVTFRRKFKRKGLFNFGCYWTSWYSLYTYRIHKKPRLPGGTISGKTTYTSTDGKARIYLNYHKSSSYPKVVRKIKLTVNNAERTITNYSNRSYIPFSYDFTEFGSYTISSQVMDECGGWQPGPNKTVHIKPTCYADNPHAVSLDLSTSDPSNITRHGNNLLEVAQGVKYEVKIKSVSDFDSHYNLEHDGGNDITLNGKQLTIHSALGSYKLNPVPMDNTRRDECRAIPPIRLFVGGHDSVIQHPNGCMVTLPEDFPNLGFKHVTVNDPALTHFRATVKSKKGFVIKPGITLSKGAELILDYEPPVVDESELDPNMNFIESTAYDDYGRVILQSRQYFDDKGNATQSQTKNLTKDVIITTQVVNDFLGRPVLTTLPAPSKAGTVEINQDVCGDKVQTGAHVRFEYRKNFINGVSNKAYDYTQFDIDPAAQNRTREQNPLPVANNEEGTLGWYYSANNGTATGKANRKMNEPAIPHSAYPYIRTLFHHDGTQSVKSIAGPGEALRAGSGHVAVADYVFIDENDPYLADYLSIRAEKLGYPYPTTLPKAENFSMSISTDAMGNTTRNYTDKAGNGIISLYFGKQNIPITRSYQFYDKAGRLQVSLSPNGWEQYRNGDDFDSIDKTTYTYDFRGRVLSITTPDAGRTDYMHRRDGSIRFSQNALQKENHSFSYTNYDPAGRPIESGQLVMSDPFDLRPVLKPALEALGREWISSLAGNPTRQDWIASTYDSPDAGFSTQSGITDRTQRFVRGSISYTENKTTKTWYSYDERGRVTWVAQYIRGLGVKLIEYTYGPTGDVQLVAYQRGQSDQFYHFYQYDKDGRLSKVYTATSEPKYDIHGKLENPKLLTQQALYDYYLHGPLKRIELADQLQGIDFVYTITGALKSINDADIARDPGGDGKTNSFKPDVFGMTLDYYPGDHQRGTVVGTGTAQYTGNIKAQSWHSPVDPGKQRSYRYDYDSRYQLSNATFGDINAGNFVPGAGAYRVDITNGYDANGNIRGLIRKNARGTNRHHFTYNYAARKNQLTSVSHAGSPYRSYTYNPIGQMTAQVNQANGEKQLVAYDASGKVTSVYLQQGEDTSTKRLLSSYTYDDRGWRSSKKTYKDDGTTLAHQTWYVRDASGLLMRSYHTDRSLDEHPIYGAGRIGMYRPHSPTNNYLYEVNDHLGNVRAVLGTPHHLTYTATMETDITHRLQEEEKYFANIPNTRWTFVGANKTLNGSKVAALNQAKPIGPALMTSVSPGDTLYIHTWAYYEAGSGYNKRMPLASIISAVSGAYGGSPTGSEQARQTFGAFNNALTAFGTGNGGSDTAPNAHLNYILFNRDMMPIQHGFVPVTSAARNNPDKERIALDPLNIAIEGILYVYVSNTSASDHRVYFDDLTITHHTSPVVYANDHYPFGLPMAGRQITRERYRYDYQGQYAEKDEETGWNYFMLRDYDPVIGRWLSTDPYGQYWSPYLGMGNNPGNLVDPDGGFTCDTCPKDPYYDKYRNSNLDYAYSSLVSGDGVYQYRAGVTVTAGLDLGFSVRQGQSDFFNHDITQYAILGLTSFVGAEAFLMQKAFQASQLSKLAVQVGRVWGKVWGKGVTNIIPEGKLANHIFSGKAGKFIDNAANRKLVTNLTNSSKHLQGVDKYGKSWFARTLDNGTQIYGYTKGGVVKGAGINQTPVNFITRYGLK